jgi:hypothetical protein
MRQLWLDHRLCKILGKGFTIFFAADAGLAGVVVVVLAGVVVVVVVVAALSIHSVLHATAASFDIKFWKAWGGLGYGSKIAAAVLAACQVGS